MTYIHHYSTIQSTYSLPQRSSVLYLFILLSSLITGNQGSSYCLYSFTFSRMSCRWDHTIYYLFILASLAYYNAFNVFLFFHGLIAHFFFVMNKILLSDVTVCLWIHLLKFILVASKFSQFWIKLIQILCLGLCMDTNFHLFGINTKKHNCWITWKEYIYLY